MKLIKQLKSYREALEQVGIRATYTVYGIQDEIYYEQLTTESELEYVPSELNYRYHDQVNYD